MAKQHSDDPGSADLGGDLGEVMANGMMVQEFEDATFALEVGKISEPVRTQFGYHLIQVQEVTEGRTMTLDEVREQIKAALLDEKKRAEWDAWLTEARAQVGVVYRDDLAPLTTEAIGTDEEGDGEAPGEGSNEEGDSQPTSETDEETAN